MGRKSGGSGRKRGRGEGNREGLVKVVVGEREARVGR